MIVRTEITDEQAAAAIEAGDFGTEITKAADNVAVVLTQSWCPQWIVMEKWLRGFERDGKPDGYDLMVLHYVYDKTGAPRGFRKFKERVLGNHQIPYVRYYQGGRLIAQSNYLGSRDFLAVFANAAETGSTTNGGD